jgi:hypothetical protein
VFYHTQPDNQVTMLEQTIIQDATIRPSESDNPTESDFYSLSDIQIEEFHRVATLLQKIHEILDITFIREERVRFIIAMYIIINENSDIIKLHKGLHTSLQHNIIELSAGLNTERREEKILHEILKITKTLLN